MEGSLALQYLQSSCTLPGDCSICLLPFSKVTLILGCYHPFCCLCINTWSRHLDMMGFSSTCPLCKGRLETLIYMSRNGHFHLEGLGDETESRTLIRKALYKGQLVRRTKASTALKMNILKQRKLKADKDLGNSLDLKNKNSEQNSAKNSEQMLKDSEQSTIYKMESNAHEIETPPTGGILHEIPKDIEPIIGDVVFIEPPQRKSMKSWEEMKPWIVGDIEIVLGSQSDALLFYLIEGIWKTHENEEMRRTTLLYELQPFFMEKTDLFITELILFANCALNMNTYDEFATYECLE